MGRYMAKGGHDSLGVGGFLGRGEEGVALYFHYPLLLLNICIGSNIFDTLEVFHGLYRHLLNSS